MTRIELPELPPPSPEAQEVSAALLHEIAHEIAASGGWISFARFMERALYAPGLGYYSAGYTKLGAAGDFITAPELSPLFARCLARQLADLRAAGLDTILELGPGSGALAAELLPALDALGCPPAQYLMLELSADLRQRQQETLRARAPGGLERVRWLDALPEHFEGIILGNEVLDATPVHIVHTRAGIINEVGVGWDNGPVWRECAADGELLTVATAVALPDDYRTEINLAARALTRSLATVLERGVLLFCDYGFPAREFYHPQRSRGTLMCHYRHRTHDDPLCMVGLQDITAHVDFSAVATAAVNAGAAVLGYANQAQFLINTGITDLLGAVSPERVRDYAPLAAQAQKLLSPAEMGELFKVIALGKNVQQPLLGFTRGDRSHTL